MKVRDFLGGLLLFSMCVTAGAATTPPKLVVTILVDQMRYDYLERFASQFTNGGFRLFLDEGVSMTFARYNYCPTFTGPGHASYLSGATPSIHGIIGNEWFDKKTGKQMLAAEDDTENTVGASNSSGRFSPRNFVGANFCDQMRLQYGSKVVGISIKDRAAIFPAGKKPLAAYWFDSASTNFVTSTYYRKELPEWVRKFNSNNSPAKYNGKIWNLLTDLPTGAPAFSKGPEDIPYRGKNEFPHKVTVVKSEGAETFQATPYGNEFLLEFARAAIEGEQLGKGPQPDVLTISFSSTDICGHKFGPYSPEMKDIILRLDRQLADFFQYLQGSIGLSNVVMVLTADHGVSPSPEFSRSQGFPGTNISNAEKMAELSAKLDHEFGQGEYFRTTGYYQGNLYFNHSLLEKRKVPLRDLVSFIREWAFETGDYEAVYSREQLLEGRAPGLIGQMVINGYNPERSGDMVLVLKPFAMVGKEDLTTHGSPFTFDTHVPVLFYGAPFVPGHYADEFYITDLAATLSAALHVDPPSGCMGKPFAEALADP